MTDEKQKWSPGVWEASPQDRVLTGPSREEHASWIITADNGTEDGIAIACVDNAAGECTAGNALLMAASKVMARTLAKFVAGYEDALRRSGRGQTAPVDPPVIASARAALDLAGWQWGGR